MQVTLADGRVLEYLAFGDPRGRPVVLFPGTPATAGCGALLADAATDSGVRLIVVSRPGYGASSTSPPGLASVARDTVELMDDLGLDRVGVHGTSGGGPFALALAAVAPDRVGGVVVSAGPGSFLEVGGLSPTEAAAVARAEAGDGEGAWRLFHAEAVEQFGDASGMSAAEFQARVFPSGPPSSGYFDRRPEMRGVFVADMHLAVQRLDGYLRDNLSWCGSWDIDLSAITAPVLLSYGLDDVMVPSAHGEWLAARLPHAQLEVRAGGHGDITFGRAADAFSWLAEPPRPPGG
jgi:pimeloyl-ACP methyl ester carboxylesterase